MKNFVIAVLFVLAAGFSSAQGLKKGNVMGLHVPEITLAPGVTVEQYNDFVLNKLVREYEKHYKGVKGYLFKGIKGDSKGSLGFVLFFTSKADWEKYFSLEGPQPEAGKIAYEKMKPILAEWNKLGKSVDHYTIWEVQ